MVAALEMLNRVHIAPIMATGGFERAGRTYWRAADNGDQVFVAIGNARTAPDEVRFAVRWSVLTMTQWRWYSRNDPQPGPPDPNLTWSLTNDLIAPGSPPGALWSFATTDDADRDRCGARLASTIADDLAPWLVSMLDRDALLAELAAPSRPWMPGMSGQPRREITALLGHAPRGEIERRLPLVEEYSPDDNFREWVSGQLETAPTHP